MTQDSALKILKTGRNVFLTGAPGTGKTYVLNEYVKYLKENKITVGITASTGIAATHINGMTIHSWSGIGIKNHLSEWDLDALAQKQYLVKRIEKAQVLVIDEVSMLSRHTFDAVNSVCKLIKRNNSAFGGMQVVLSGDFFQLPPIANFYKDNSAQEELFICNSVTWKDLNIKTCYLTQQYRHKDSVYTSLLNEIRSGNISDNAQKLLRMRIEAKSPKNIEITRLYTHNKNVDRKNEEELSKINKKTFSYEMSSGGRASVAESLKKSVLVPETLHLKEGASVMFIKNDKHGRYANGTLGKIIGFESNFNDKLPIVKTLRGEEVTVEPAEWTIEEEGKSLARIKQIPLRLAWAITVHKSQGMSLDAAEIDLSGAFAPGQGYVALSRLRFIDGLFLIGINDSALKMSPFVLELDGYLKRESRKWEKVIKKFNNKEIKKMFTDFINKC